MKKYVVDVVRQPNIIQLIGVEFKDYPELRLDEDNIAVLYRLVIVVVL